MLIQSPDNPKIKLIRKLLSNASFRRQSDFFVIESQKPIQEMINNNPKDIEFVLIREGAEKIIPDNINVFEVTAKIFDQTTSLETSPGLLALVKKKKNDFDSIAKELKKVVILDGVQAPSNLGAVVRNAVAFKIDALLLTKGTVDQFHPKAINSMAGNINKIPIFEDAEKYLSLLANLGFGFYILDPKAKKSIKGINISKKTALIFGSEGQGLSKKILEQISYQSLRIPIAANVESLNIAVSTGIVFYELNIC